MKIETYTLEGLRTGKPCAADMELEVNPTRLGVASTGIYVRAKNGDKWGSYDICELDAPSLLVWLRSRGGENIWAENCVGILLGHGQLTKHTDVV